MGRESNSRYGNLIRLVVCAYYDADKREIKDDTNNTIKVKITDERELFLKKFVNLLMKTTYINESAKIYFSTQRSTYKKVAEELGGNFNTTKANVWHSVNKVKIDFGNEMLENVLYYKDESIKVYSAKLNELLNKYDKRMKVLDELLINIHKPSRRVEILGDDEFMEFMDLIRPYIKKFKSKAEESITVEQAGYFYYLIMSDGYLKDRDKRRLDSIKELIAE